MKILFLAPNVNIKERTGDAVHVRELALNIAQLGNSVSLVAGYSSNQPNELKPLLNHPNISLTFNKNLFKIRFPLSKDFSTLLTCLKLACKNPPDIIYERCFSCKMGTMLSKILRKPLVIEVNGLVEEEAELQGTLADHRFTKNIRIRLRRFFFKSSNMIVTVSQGIKEELQRKYHISPDKIVVIQNGADTNLFRPMNKKKVQVEFGLSPEFKYICFVGNLAPWQGVEYLIDAAPEIIKKIPNIKFIIVGDGIMKRPWEKRVENKLLTNNFVFVGSVPFEIVPKYINASDICVALFSETRKCSPIKVFEYLACGKPVILNRVGDEFNIFNKSKSTLIFSLNDQKKFVNYIYDILSSEKRMIQMSIDGRNFILSKYTWRITAQRVSEVCTNLNNR